MLKGGRPKGIMREFIKAASDNLVATKNKISLKYLEMKQEAATWSRILENWALKKLVAKVSKKRILPDGCVNKK